jgi:hypothetical protein
MDYRVTTPLFTLEDFEAVWPGSPEAEEPVEGESDTAVLVRRYHSPAGEAYLHHACFRASYIYEIQVIEDVRAFGYLSRVTGENEAREAGSIVADPWVDLLKGLPEGILPALLARARGRLPGSFAENCLRATLGREPAEGALLAFTEGFLDRIEKPAGGETSGVAVEP